MSQQHCLFDASRSLTALEQDSTIIAVIEMSPIGVRDASEIEGAVTAFAREPRGGLIPAPDAFINTRRH